MATTSTTSSTASSSSWPLHPPRHQQHLLLGNNIHHIINCIFVLATTSTTSSTAFSSSWPLHSPRLRQPLLHGHNIHHVINSLFFLASTSTTSTSSLLPGHNIHLFINSLFFMTTTFPPSLTASSSWPQHSPHHQLPLLLGHSIHHIINCLFFLATTYTTSSTASSSWPNHPPRRHQQPLLLDSLIFNLKNDNYLWVLFCSQTLSFYFVGYISFTTFASVPFTLHKLLRVVKKSSKELDFIFLFLKHQMVYSPSFQWLYVHCTVAPCFSPHLSVFLLIFSHSTRLLLQLFLFLVHHPAYSYSSLSNYLSFLSFSSASFLQSGPPSFSSSWSPISEWALVLLHLPLLLVEVPQVAPGVELPDPGHDLLAVSQVS